MRFWIKEVPTEPKYKYNDKVYPVNFSGTQPEYTVKGYIEGLNNQFLYFCTDEQGRYGHLYEKQLTNRKEKDGQ